MRSVVAFGVAVVLAGAAIGAPPEFHEAVEGDGPILWYQFNELEGSAEVANHGSLGSGYDGVLNNGASLEALTLDGDTGVCLSAAQSQFVESKSAAPDSMTGNPDFTAEAVVRLFDPFQSGYYAPFLHWGANATGSAVFFGLRGNEGDRAFVGFYNGGMRMTGTFEVARWVHLVWVRDSGGGANDTQTGSTLYVDGEATELKADENGCCNPVPTVASTVFRVSKAGGDANRYFTGGVDEVVLYDRMLSADEIMEHYQALTGSVPCEPDLNGDGTLDLFDFLAFVNLFNSKDPRADCTPIGCEPQLDLFDFLCFVNKFNAGCP